MKIAVGAPVAERHWVLDHWFDRLKNQTVLPDYFCFVYSPSKDSTWSSLQEYCPNSAELIRVETKLPYYSRSDRHGDPKDPWRATHMSNLRNHLRKLFLSTDADVFISLDTDVLLKRRDSLEQLIQTVQEGWDVANGLTYLHPLGPASLCFNAGFLGGGEEFTQVWQRADTYTFGRKPPSQIDIPMAFFAIRRHVMAMCNYKSHECGEDIGFAQNLKKHKFRVGWRTDIEGQHVMGQEYLEELCSVEAVAQD